MATFIVNIHLCRLVVIQLLPNTGLVLGGQSRPRLVRSPAGQTWHFRLIYTFSIFHLIPVVLMAWRHLYVVIELYNLDKTLLRDLLSFSCY